MDPRRAAAALALLAGCGRTEPVNQERSTTVAVPLEPTVRSPTVDDDGDGFAVGGDCNDADDTVFPGAVEVCGDGRTTDCLNDASIGHATIDGQSYRDLSAALADASPGAEILVCGRFVGAFVAPVPVVLRGFVDPAVAAPTIDARSSGTALVVPGGTVVEDLTITGGHANVGGGLALSDVGTVVLRRSHVQFNTARMGAGVALTPGSTLSLEASEIRDATADEGGGGVWVRAGGTLELDATSTVDGTALYGGGVLLEDATLRGGTVDGHTTGADPIDVVGGVVGGTRPIGGAGVAVTGTSRIEETAVSGYGYQGGGISAFAADLTLSDVHLGGSADSHGGGLLALASTVRLEGTSDIVGGYAYFGGNAALFDATLIGGTLTGGFVIGNGSGIYVEWGTVEGSVVREGSGNGAAVNVGVEGRLVDVVVEDNAVTGIEALPWSNFDFAAVPGRLVLDGGVVARNGHAQGEVANAGALFSLIPVDAADTVFDANWSYSGPAGLAGQTTITLTGGAVTSHTPYDAATAVLVNAPDAVFTAIGVDFGAGGTANLGADVLTVDTVATPWDFDGLVSATCTIAGCVPL